MNIIRRIKQLLFVDVHLAELLKKGAVALLLRVGGAGLAFLFTIYFARLLGPGDYGLFTLALTVVTVLSVFVRMGFDVVLMKHVAVAIEQGNVAIARGYVHSAVQVVFYIGSIVTLIFVFIIPTVSVVVFNKPELISPLRVMIWLLLPLSFMMLHVEALKGLKHVTDSVFIQNIIVPGLSLFVLVVVSRWHVWTLEEIVTTYVMATFCAAIYSRLSWRKRIQSGELFKVKKRELIAKGFPLLLVTSGSLVMSWSDTIVLGIYKNSEDVGIYSVASKTAFLTSIILFAVNSIAAPKYASFYASNNIGAMARLARQSTILMISLAFFPIAIFLIWPEWFLSLYGAGYMAGSTVLIILTIGQVINVSCGSVGYILLTTGHEKVVRNIMLITAFINIGLNILLVQFLGVTGVALATMISVLIWNIWMLISVRKLLGFWTIYNSY